MTDLDVFLDAMLPRLSHEYNYEVLAGGVSGDLAYIVGIEHITASIGGAPAAPYALRVTTIFRREGGEWKVVHRHGDPHDRSSTTRVERLGSTAGAD